MQRLADPRLGAITLQPALRQRMVEMFLIRQLLRAGTLDPSTAKQAIARSQHTGRPLTRLLVQDRFVTRAQMRETLGALRRFMRFSR